MILNLSRMSRRLGLILGSEPQLQWPVFLRKVGDGNVAFTEQSRQPRVPRQLNQIKP